jgi:hypothetical protein
MHWHRAEPPERQAAAVPGTVWMLAALLAAVIEDVISLRNLQFRLASSTSLRGHSIPPG